MGPIDDNPVEVGFSFEGMCSGEVLAGFLNSVLSLCGPSVPQCISALCFLPGGLFEYVSAANYFGEVVEWCGYGLASWSVQGGAFALFTFCVLLSRALQHHR